MKIKSVLSTILLASTLSIANASEVDMSKTMFQMTLLENPSTAHYMGIGAACVADANSGYIDGDKCLRMKAVKQYANGKLSAKDVERFKILIGTLLTISKAEGISSTAYVKSLGF